MTASTTRAAEPSVEAVDRLAVVGLAVLSVVEAVAVPVMDPAWQQGLLSLSWCLPLLARRRFPVEVLAAVVVGAGTLQDQLSSGGQLSFVLAGVLAAFGAGRYLVGRRWWWGPALSIGWWWAYYAVSGGELSDYEFSTLIYGGAWAVGYVLRRRAGRIVDLSSEASRLRAEAVERERVAVDAERARLARELHDVVTHSISVVVIQTQAIRHRLDPAQATEIADLHAVETTARQALAEMRRLLGVLRAEDSPPALAPQPGLDQVPRLVRELASAGLAIEYRIAGKPAALPPGTDLAAYRVIQEALTNVLAHAAGAETSVEVCYRGDLLTVRVLNAPPPAGSRAVNGSGGGRGLVGMRERLALYRGSLAAAPTAEGGFAVEATLPLRGDEGMSG